MRFSLFFFSAEDVGTRDKYRLLLESARFADRNGFHAVWTPERHFQRFGGPYPNPAITGAALAAITERIRIRAGGVILPLYHPVRVAENFAVVDNLSNGRVEIACVAGAHPDDYALRPEAYPNAEDVLRDGVETVKALWRGEKATVHSGTGRRIEVELYPKPVQPEITIWRVCNREESCRIAGEHGVDVLTSMLYDTAEGVQKKISAYKRAKRGAGHDEGTGRVALMVHAFVGADAREVAWPAYRRYLQTNLDLQRTVAEATGRTLREPSPEDREFLFENAFQRLLATHGLVGSVDDCVRKARIYQSWGVDEIACLVDFGIDTDAVLESLPSLCRVKDALDDG